MKTQGLNGDCAAISDAERSRALGETVEIDHSLPRDDAFPRESEAKEFRKGKAVQRVLVRLVLNNDYDSANEDAADDISPVVRSIYRTKPDQEKPPHDRLDLDVNGNVEDSSSYESIQLYTGDSATETNPNSHLIEPKTPSLNDGPIYKELDGNLFELYEYLTAFRDESRFSTFRKDHRRSSRVEREAVKDGGLKDKKVDQPIKVTVNSQLVKHGQLSCRCRAPSGAVMYAAIRENKDGTYRIDFKATESGLHTVEVERHSQPIPGSPFVVRITQTPDAKKVQAYGYGLESGLIKSFRGQFKVETKGAGPGTLKIRIHGPKGAFRVEMSRDHPKDRTINVKYNPTEPGMYTANVFWSDEHVPGSPFGIFVAQDAEHLRKWENNREHIHKQEGLMNGR